MSRRGWRKGRAVTIDSSDIEFSGFSRTLKGKSACARPEKRAGAAALIGDCAASGRTLTVRGGGHSYGDAAFGRGGVVLDVSRLNRIHHADWTSGAVIAEPGLTFRELFMIAGPKGFAPAVAPGFSAITIGGAFAMDVHGKNHRRAGGFSRCVRAIDLRLANGDLLHCSREENADIFAASAGGLGRTGAIERLHLALAPAPPSLMRQETIPVDGLGAALARLEENTGAASVVYWGDLLNARDADAVKGAVIAAAPDPAAPPIEAGDWAPLAAPPLGLLAPFYNELSNRAFNAAYGRKLRAARGGASVPLRAHLFTWDGLSAWNRLYGRRGFFEYQFVLPGEHKDRIGTILNRLIENGARPYLFAMKLMQAGEGLLSYGAKDGVSVLVDMPATARARAALDAADDAVADAGGRIHLAKDSRLGAAAFQRLYASSLPAFRAVVGRVDPDGVFASAMTARLGLDGAS